MSNKQPTSQPIIYYVMMMIMMNERGLPSQHVKGDEEGRVFLKNHL